MNLLLEKSVPQVFGWQHITFLIVMCTVGILSVILIKKYCNTDEKLSKAIKIYSAILLVFIVTNRICVAVNRQSIIHFIPSTFCGMASFMLAISGLFVKKDSNILHLLSYCAVVGGLVTMIYPDFVTQNVSFMYPATYSGLMHHTIMFFLSVTMFATGYVKPTLKKWHCLMLGLCAMLSFGLLLIDLFNVEDAMYINNPVLSGTPLTWYVLGAIFIPLVTIVELVCDLVRKHKQTKNNNLEQEKK